LQPRKGLKRKYRKPPAQYPHAQACDEPMRHGVAPTNAAVRKESGAALAAPARARGDEELERKARFPALRAGNAPGFSKKSFVMLNCRPEQKLLDRFEKYSYHRIIVRGFQNPGRLGCISYQ
jgi:hypothetical protein